MIYRQGNLSFSNVTQVYSVTYKGRGVSNNQFYAGGAGRKAWKIRAGIKAKYSKIFDDLLQEIEIKWMDQYALVIVYNSRMDCDNVVGGMAKLMLDSLKEERLKDEIIKPGWVYDDSKKYCKGVFAMPDESLPNDTYNFHILHLK